MKKSGYISLLITLLILPLLVVLLSSMLYISRTQYTLDLTRLSDLTSEGQIYLEVQTQDVIFASTYWMQDDVIRIVGYATQDTQPLLITVEMEGVSTRHEQLVDVGLEPINIRISPPFLEGIDLSEGRTAQLTYSIRHNITGEVFAADSTTISISSIYEMNWVSDELGEANTFTMLSWLEPSSLAIQELLRFAVDYLELHTDGKVNMMLGYQEYGIYDDIKENTWIQAIGIMGALSDMVQLRYVNTVFAEVGEQRIQTPTRALEARSGVCAETVLIVASALQASGMNVMIVLPPGHAQVAVETWPGSGDYFLIETTSLPMGNTRQDWERVVTYKNRTQWRSFLAEVDDVGNGVLVMNTDHRARMGIPPLGRVR